MNAEVRVIKTPAEQALVAAYAAARAKLPGKGAVSALREEAFRRFDAQGLPHRRVEEWKYTDLRALMRDVKPLAVAPDQAAIARAKSFSSLLSGIESRRLIFVDGVLVPELSDLTPEKGLSIGSLASELAKGDSSVADHIGTAIKTKDPAVALNTALMGDGAVVRIAAGTKIVRPIQLIFTGAQSASIFTRSLVVLEKGASVSLIESHEGSDAQINTALEFIVGDDAYVDHLKITSGQSLHLSSLMALIGARVKFSTFAFTPGSAVVRNQMFFRFSGEHSEATVGGASLLRGRQHADTTLVIDHAAAGCSSRERFKSVLDDESRGIFQGKIVVAPNAQKTDAKMVSNALLLSDDAEADNKPELEIFADDVQCGHGATAGALDPNLLFYLRARGIPEKEAEALLIQAFIGDAVEMIAHEGIRDALMGAAVKWLEARN